MCPAHFIRLFITNNINYNTLNYKFKRKNVQLIIIIGPQRMRNQPIIDSLALTRYVVQACWQRQGMVNL